MAAQRDESGIDVLKFFIGVMSLLTVIVAGFAGYNWSRAAALAQAVEADELRLAEVEKLASDRTLLEMIARDRAQQGEIDSSKEDLGQFLNTSATLMKLQLQNFRAVGSGAAVPGQQRYVKKSYQFAIERQPLEVIADYLFYVQAKWPGLKVEKVSIREVPVKKGEHFAGWQASVLVSAFRPKD